MPELRVFDLREGLSKGKSVRGSEKVRDVGFEGRVGLSL